MSTASRCVHSSECFDASGSSLHLGMCLLEETTVLLVDITRGCEFYTTPTGGAASSTTAAGTSEEEGLHTCPLPHILEVSLLPQSPGTSEEKGLAPLPSSSQLPVTTSEEEGQALLLTLTASTSEEEGQAFLLTPSVSASCQRSGRTMS